MFVANNVLRLRWIHCSRCNVCWFQALLVRLASELTEILDKRWRPPLQTDPRRTPLVLQAMSYKEPQSLGSMCWNRLKENIAKEVHQIQKKKESKRSNQTISRGKFVSSKRLTVLWRLQGASKLWKEHTLKSCCLQKARLKQAKMKKPRSEFKLSRRRLDKTIHRARTARCQLRRAYRLQVVEEFLKAGIPLRKIDKLRPSDSDLEK